MLPDLPPVGYWLAVGIGGFPPAKWGRGIFCGGIDMTRNQQASYAIAQLALACDLSQGPIMLDREEIQALLTIVNQQVRDQINHDAREDEVVDKLLSALCYAEDCLITAFEVSDDYTDSSLLGEARDYYLGNIERARAA
jgi:hypothetical protein